MWRPGSLKPGKPSSRQEKLKIRLIQKPYQRIFTFRQNWSRQLEYYLTKSGKNVAARGFKP